MPDGPLLVVPDLAVEVVSPNDRQYDVDHKVAEYLEVGVKLVWVINPDTRVVVIYRADGTIAGVREGGRPRRRGRRPRLPLPRRRPVHPLNRRPRQNPSNRGLAP